MNYEPCEGTVIMNYDFLPLIPHTFAYGTEQILPHFMVSSKAKETLIYPVSFSLLKASYDYYIEGNNQGFYEIRYILDGEGYLKYNGRSYLLKKGEGCLIDCRHKYYYQTNSYNWVSTSFYFNGTPAIPLVSNYLLSGNVKFTNTMFSNFEPLQMHILQCTQKSSSYMEYEVSCTFYMLLTNLLIAQSKTHMTRRFKEYTGFAPHEYLTQIRIYNAKYLLKATDLSIEDISRQTGFSDSVYFIQVFKKIEGITPSKFRKREV